MNWKTEAVDKLRHYEARKNALKSIPEELKSLRSARRSLRSVTSDSAPTRGGGNNREDVLLSSMVKEQELEQSLEQAQIWVENVESGLSVLTEEERLVLDRFYINSSKGAAERLADELNLDVKTVYRHKDIALRRFTIALYGCVES